MCLAGSSNREQREAIRHRRPYLVVFLMGVILGVVLISFLLFITRGESKPTDEDSSTRPPVPTHTPRGGERYASVEDLESAWYEQMEGAPEEEICKPRPQFIFPKECYGHEKGVPVERCPQGCRACADPSHTCTSKGERNVTRVALCMNHPDDSVRSFRNVTVQEDTGCECVYVKG